MNGAGRGDASQASGLPRIAVVVVSWNQRERLAQCLESIAAQNYPERQIVVVDNGSADGSSEMVSAQYPEAQLISSARNLGFGAGNNLAIRATDTPYVATLNNDAVADPGWLEALVERMQADPSLGSVASKMVLQHDPATIDSCGIALDRAGIAWDLWGGYPASLVGRSRPVFGPCAGAALYRRAMLDDVGLFDEDFFAYLEDVDLAWRARLRGWGCVLAPDAVAHHAHSGTLGEASPLKRYLLARNKIWTIAKCAPAEDLRTDLPTIALYDVGAVAFAVARHRDWASARGRLDGLRSLPSALRKRREIQARRTTEVAELRALYAPLAAPWDVPRRYRHLVGDRGQGTAWGTGDRGQGTGARAGDGAGNVRNLRELARLAILRTIGALLPRPPTPDPRPLAGPRVVILRPDHLGDVLLSRPAVEAVRAIGGSGAQITVVVGPWAANSLQGLDVRVAAFPFPGFTRTPKGSFIAPYSNLAALAARLQSENYDAALILRPDHWWGALAAALAGIRVRVGHDTPATSPFLTHRVPHLREHAAAAALRAAGQLLAALGQPRPSEPPHVRFEPSGQAAQDAARWGAASVSTGAPLVAIHPGAGSALKTWPAGRWAAIADGLPADAAVVLTGGLEDAPLVAAIRELAARDVCADLDLDWDHLAALYARADVVLGMDSGPLHLAAAVGTPTVRVYGPTDPEVYGPAGGGGLHVAVRGTLPCAPCGNLIAPPCGYRQDPPCLAAARVSEVVTEATGRLRAPTPS